MKGLIIACLLALALPVLAADRYEVSVKIYRHQADSLLVAQQISAVQAADSLMGEYSISNGEFFVIGRMAKDTTGLPLKFMRVVRKVSPRGKAEVKIEKIKPEEVLGKVPK